MAGSSEAAALVEAADPGSGMPNRSRDPRRAGALAPESSSAPGSTPQQPLQSQMLLPLPFVKGPPDSRPLRLQLRPKPPLQCIHLPRGAAERLP